jgi:hypothetical protein
MAVLVAVFYEPQKMTLSGELTSVVMPVVAHQDQMATNRLKAVTVTAERRQPE